MCNKIVKWKVEFLQRFVLKSDSSTVLVLSILTNLQYFEYFWGNLILSGSNRNNTDVHSSLVESVINENFEQEVGDDLNVCVLIIFPKDGILPNLLVISLVTMEIQVIQIATWLTLVLRSRRHVTLMAVAFHGKSGPYLFFWPSQNHVMKGLFIFMVGSP